MQTLLVMLTQIQVVNVNATSNADAVGNASTNPGAYGACVVYGRLPMPLPLPMPTPMLMPMVSMVFMVLAVPMVHVMLAVLMVPLPMPMPVPIPLSRCGAYGAYGACFAYGASAYACACTHATKQMQCLWCTCWV